MYKDDSVTSRMIDALGAKLAAQIDSQKDLVWIWPGLSLRDLE